MQNLYSRPRSSWRFCFLLSVGLIGCTALCAQPLQSQSPGDERLPPPVGLRVIEVTPGGQGHRVGLQRMDKLTKYGEFTLVDHSTYFKARESYLKNPEVKVQLEFWRGATRIIVHVFPGRLDIDTNEQNLVAYQLDAEIQAAHLNNRRPDYWRDLGVLKDLTTPDESLAKAKAILDRAEAEGTLTATQILVGRIGLILDDAPAEELKKQNVLIAEFIRAQPVHYVGDLGERFRKRGQLRPAREFLKQFLLSHPDDISVRLNIGYINLKLGSFAEAEAGADLVLTNPERLWEHGLFIAYQQKSYGALHRGDYHTSIAFAEKAFAIDPGNIELSLIQLAAARMGDMEKLNDASRRLKELIDAKNVNDNLRSDAVEALAFSLSGQDARAREIVVRWAHVDLVEGRLSSYWSKYPGGAKVVDNWRRLAAEQNPTRNK